MDLVDELLSPDNGEFGPVVSPTAKIPLRNGGWLQFEILLDTALLDALAEHTGLSVDELLEDAERWATGVGLIHGVVVDREKRTVTRVGEAVGDG